jgi:tRNA(Ile)-lysidine synthase
VTGPPPGTAAVRVAVRRHLQDVTGPVVAAVSGGADSLALAAGLAFERPGSGAVIVDHGLQPGSAEVAARAAAQCAALGLAATVAKAELSGEGGPEARARSARYAVLDGVDGTVLLGHTSDDQAETVLLGLIRGSGARALSGMAPVRGKYRRPLLEVSRATTRLACVEAGLEPWDDPHNDDPAFRRVVVRRVLEELQVSDGLVRSARLLREDADALDALAQPESDVAALAAMVPALRARSLKKWAELQTGRAVTSVQVEALRALVEDWHGQGPVALRGGGQVRRIGGRLAFEP